MFLASWKNSKARLLNLHHVSGAILGHSKVIFYDHILHFLKTLDASKAELCYLDTDSIILALSAMTLEECLDPGQKRAYEDRLEATFVQDDSSKHQTGKLKVEMVAKTGKASTLWAAGP